MANEDSALREVDQELAEERQWAMFRKYGPALIGASAALVIGVGAWQVFDATQTSAANKEAVQFSEAIDLLLENEPDGRDALAAIASDGGSGYAALAQFRRAASFAAAKDRNAAVGVFEEIYNDNSVPQAMRGLARIRAGYLTLQDGRDAALAHLGPLAEREGAYKPYADEITGLAALKAEDYETALSIFTSLSAAPDAPPGIALRADEYLALAVAGKAGVDLAGRFELEDIVGAIGQVDGDAEIAPSEAPAVDETEPATEPVDEAATEPVEPAENGNEQ